MSLIENPWASALIGRLCGRQVFRSLVSWPRELQWTERNLAVFVSFDCDTPSDMQVMPELISKLDEAGVKASFAVTGYLASDHWRELRELVSSGHELVCHGHALHTRETEDGPAVMELFYDRIPWEEACSDLLRGRSALQDAANIRPMGFRTPHFGTFQQRHQLTTLHRFLKESGFRYSTSALSFYAKRHSLLDEASILPEFPITPSLHGPISQVDSWSYIVRDHERGRPPRFYKRLRAVVEEAKAMKRPALVNFYVDPSHVAGSNDFANILADIGGASRDGQLWTGTYSMALGGIK